MSINILFVKVNNTCIDCPLNLLRDQNKNVLTWKHTQCGVSLGLLAVGTKQQQYRIPVQW